MTDEKSYKRHSIELPPHLSMSDRASLDWRVSRLESTVDDHSDHLEDLRARPQLPALPSLPWLRIAVLLVLLGLSLKGHLEPEQAKSLALKLFGVSSGR